MKFSIFTAAGLLLLSSCTSNTAHEDAPKHSENKEEVIAATPNRLLTVEIEGMVCEMGCGSSIRKELKKTNAVCSIDFDFEAERASNTAKIAFDKDKVTVDEILATINTINEKQFKTGATSSEVYSCPNSSNGEHPSSCSKTSHSKVTSSIEIPNILDIVAQLF